MSATFICIIALLALAKAQTAETITLTGTIRDFSQNHPDFEKFVSPEKGVVETQLGIDKKPVYIDEPHYSFSTKANFDQWYRNVKGVNQWMDYPITLTKKTDSPNVYFYENDAFFPIDNLLIGNEDNVYGHNYHFTFELHCKFTYQKGQTFRFIGDDDIWVFINNQLVIDLGGPHPPLEANIDLDTIKDLVEGNTYDLDFFFAERHTSGSSFLMETSIVLEKAPELCPYRPEQQAVFRWHHPNSNDHFYTADPDGEIAAQSGYNQEKIGFYTLVNNPNTNKNTIHRLWNGVQHFYTISSTESQQVQANKNYKYEGVLGYVYAKQELYTVPLTRYYSATEDRHFYSINGEVPNSSYVAEGIMGYVYANI